MKVSSVMNPNVETCRPEDDLAQAAMLMWRRDCGFAPVVDGDGKRVVGVITDRDICMATATKHATPETLKVKETMSSRVVSDDEIEDALDRMRTHQVHRIPVLDHADRLAGVLSFSDVVRMASTDGKIRTIGDHDLVSVYRAIKSPREPAAVTGDSRLERDRAFGETRDA